VEIPKPSEEDKQFFRSLIEPDPEVEVKPMFGNLGAFVHGNMFAGLFGSAVGVRLGRALDERLPQPARNLARRRRPGRALGGEGPGLRRLAAAQGAQGAQGRQA
jgi:TfoX/Sxy family transcriptional regulator of competence genes